MRYRVDHAQLGGRRRADIGLTRRQVAIVIDGCFWHECPERATLPKLHTEYWLPKLEHKIERDRETDEKLRRSGGMIRRLWEHEDPAKVVKVIMKLVQAT